MLDILFKLVIIHFLLDFPLQGDFTAKAKNHLNPIPNVPWQWPMIAHCAIQAGGVWFVTGRLGLAVIEFILHFAIDYSKNAGIIDFSQDQLLHLFCKALYFMFLPLIISLDFVL